MQGISVRQRQTVVEQLEERSLLSAPWPAPIPAAGLSGVTLRVGQTVAKPAAPVSSPLVIFQILGSSSPNGPFSDTMQVVPGQTVYYEVLGGLASVGTSNIIGSYAITIKTKTAHPKVRGLFYDGINSLNFNLLGSAGNPFQVNFNDAALAANPTTGDDYRMGIGAQPGIPTGNQLLDVRPVQRAGGFAGAAGMELILSGSFTVAANAPAGAISQITGTWGTSCGGFAINCNPATGSGSTKLIISPGSEHGASPFASFATLKLITPANAAPLARGAVPASQALPRKEPLLF